MLYDKRWDAVDPVLDAFAAFLRGMPTYEDYTYHSFDACACAQYCRKTRLWRDRLWLSAARKEHEREVWWRFNSLAGYHPHTFGALLRRVEDRAPREHRFPQW